MEIKDISVDVLQEYENNPRNNDNAVAKVAESIKEFGFKVPVIVDENNVIVAGHTRVRAAKQLGLKTVPCIIADDLTPAQIKAFRLADNKVSEFSSWDENKLYTEIMELQTMDFDIESFGFETQSLDDDDNEITEDVEEDEDIELPREEIGSGTNGLYLKFDNKKVQMTEDELEWLNEVFDNYLTTHGNPFGFVSYLIDNLR